MTKVAAKHKIAVEFTFEELQSLVTLAENQLFRVKFIDPKMGHRASGSELHTAQSAVDILHDALKTHKEFNRKSVVLHSSPQKI